MVRTKVLRNQVLRDWNSHIVFVKGERRGYWGRGDEAITEPEAVISIIIDAQDHSKTGMPAYCEIVHCTEKGFRIKLHLYGRRTTR